MAILADNDISTQERAARAVDESFIERIAVLIFQRDAKIPSKVIAEQRFRQLDHKTIDNYLAAGSMALYAVDPTKHLAALYYGLASQTQAVNFEAIDPARRLNVVQGITEFFKHYRKALIGRVDPDAMRRYGLLAVEDSEAASKAGAEL